MNPRDDFTQKTKDTLAKRVSYLCSNPQCRARTIGPKSELDQALSLGVAAHITAASVGGPRYDATLTPKERRAISNGIWTCVKCSVLVDRAPSPYSVETLRSWKADAEKQALDGLVRSEQPSSALIRVTIDGFQIYKDNRRSSDSVVFIDGFEGGDIRYEFEYCLCNQSMHPIALHRFRIEYRCSDQVIFTDEYAIQDEIELTPHRWSKHQVVDGLHRSKLETVFSKSDSLWLTVQTVGENNKYEWKIADITTPYDSLPWRG